MNKDELIKMFENIEIGKVFYDLKIEGLKDYEVGVFLQEVARKHNFQFQITINSINKYIYEVIKPSKKFLKKEGQWSLEKSNKIKNLLKEWEV